MHAGRYAKFSRELSQSPWVADGARVSESSVQELITGPLNKHFQAEGTHRANENAHFVRTCMLT